MVTLTTQFQLIKQVSIYNGSYLQTWGKYTTQTVSTNKTKVVCELRIHNNPGTGYNCYTHSCNFNGGTFDASDYKGSYYHGWGEGDHVLLSQTKELTHNADGTLTFNLGGYFTCSAGIGGTVPQESVKVPTINRRSALTLSKSTFDIGENIIATITQYVSDYHQDLYIVIGGNETLIQSDASGEVEIETSLLANTIYQQIPNAKYYSREFRLKTYDENDNLIGTDVKTYRANVVDSEPTFDVAYIDNNSTTTAITLNNQQLIQNKSLLRVQVTNASALHYATLDEVTVSINGETQTQSISGSSKNIDYGTLNLSSNTNASVTVKDSRGFTTTKTIALTILEWKTPSAIITLNRRQNFYTETDITVDANYSSLDSKNTIAIEYRYKKTSDNTWGSWTSLSDNVQSTANLDNSYAWDVEVKVTDSLASYTYTGLSVGVGTPVFFIDKLRNSIAVQGIPNYDSSVEVNGVDISNTYDTTERPIGKWMGKVLYRKVFSGTLTSSSTRQSIDLMTGIDYVVDFKGRYSPNESTPVWPVINASMPTTGTTMGGYITVRAVNGTMRLFHISPSYDGQTGSYEIAVEYTKI